MSLIAIVHWQLLFKMRYCSILPHLKWQNASINFENGRKRLLFDPIITFVPGSPLGKHFKWKKLSFYDQLAALFPTVKSKTKSENHEVPPILDILTKALLSIKEYFFVFSWSESCWENSFYCWMFWIFEVDVKTISSSKKTTQCS